MDLRGLRGAIGGGAGRGGKAVLGGDEDDRAAELLASSSGEKPRARRGNSRSRGCPCSAATWRARSSSKGAEEEMPAFETRMSMPPYSTAASVKARATACFIRHVEHDAANAVLSVRCAKFLKRRLKRFLVDVGEDARQAPSPSSRCDGGAADAAGAAGHEARPCRRGFSASACAGASPLRAASIRCRRPPAPAARNNPIRKKRRASH